jgi:uncharacterized protein YjdB
MPLASIGLAVLCGCAVGGATIVDPTAVQGVGVSPTSATVTVGGSSQTLQADVDVIRDAPTTVKWTSSDPSIATVAASGQSATVTPVKAGTVTITATSTVNTARHADATIQVMPGALARIAVTASASQITAFGTLPARAVALDVGGDTLAATFSWASTNPSVATVSSSGVVTGVGPGTVSITATSGSVASNALALTVVNPPIATIEVSAPSSSVDFLGTLQATAVAKDGSGRVLNGVVFSWASSNTLVAGVSSSGLISGRLSGTSDITATSGSVMSNVFTVTVNGGTTQ